MRRQIKGSESTNSILRMKTLGDDWDLRLLLLRLTGFEVAMEAALCNQNKHFMNDP